MSEWSEGGAKVLYGLWGCIYVILSYSGLL